MKLTIGIFLALLTVVATAQDRATPDTGAAKPRLKWAPEEFGIGRKHTANARCNRQIDKLLEDNLNCFNTRPSTECEPLMKKNTKAMGVYIRSPRCAK